MNTNRRLTTILAADLVNFSGLVARDEEGTVARVRSAFASHLIPAIEAAGGDVIKTMGDGLLAEIASPVDAARCACAIQRAMAAAEQNGEPPLSFRIGLHLCDVLSDGDDVLGDGVNLAVRLEALAEPGGICLSRAVRDQIAANFTGRLMSMGLQSVKNLPDPVEVWRLDPAQTMSPASGGIPSRAGDQPSVAVLRFSELGPPSDDFLADGIVEELTAALSGVRDFTVIARQSAFAVDERADVRHIGRTLGARYVVSGSVRRSGERVRVTVQLADTTTGSQLLTDRFEDRVEDLFDLQDRMAARVAGAISPAVRASEIAASRALAPADRGAYALYMSAFPHFWSHRKEENDRAIALLTRALERNPEEVRARALRAWAYAQQACYIWSDDPRQPRAQAIADADVAMLHVGDHAGSLVALAASISMTTTDQARARSLLDKALALDPNSAWGWMRRGWMENYIRDSEAALAAFNRAEELSPRDPFLHNIRFGRAFAYGGMGDYDKAVSEARAGLEAGPGVVWAYRDLAHFLALAGRHEEAQDALGALVRHHPELTVQVVADSMPPSAIAHHPEFLEGLRRAGLPER